jgi:hypothetical protein
MFIPAVANILSEIMNAFTAMMPNNIKQHSNCVQFFLFKLEPSPTCKIVEKIFVLRGSRKNSKQLIHM